MIPIKPSDAIWTDEQWNAIYDKGHNIIVSAGAGSGKTAVLSERVIENLKSGMSIKEVLLLTFTKAASLEMKTRIRNKIKKNPSLSKELSLIDEAYITTFDSFALSIVKKYHYILNISPNVSIIDGSLIRIKKKEILTNIFDKYYENRNEKFLKLISDFCIKDDKEIFESILSIYSKIDLKYNENLIIEGEGTISNTLKTSYKTTNFADSTSPVTKNTTIDEINGAKFENTSKKLANGGLTSSTMSGGPGWYNGFLIEGDEVTYQISTKNTGDEAGNVKLTDIIPDGTELIEAKSDNTTNISLDETVNIDGNDKKAVIWNFENVPSGETVTATIKLKITNNADFTLINNFVVPSFKPCIDALPAI